MPILTSLTPTGDAGLINDPSLLEQDNIKQLADESRELLRTGQNITIGQLGSIARDKAPDFFKNASDIDIARHYVNQHPDWANRIKDWGGRQYSESFDPTTKKITSTTTDFTTEGYDDVGKNLNSEYNKRVDWHPRLSEIERVRFDLPGSYNPQIKDFAKNALFNAKAMGMQMPAAVIGQFAGLFEPKNKDEWLNVSEFFRDYSQQRVEEWIDKDPTIQAYLNWSESNPYWTSKLSGDIIMKGLAEFAPSMALMIGTRQISSSMFKGVFASAFKVTGALKTGKFALTSNKILGLTKKYKTANKYAMRAQRARKWAGRSEKLSSLMAISALEGSGEYNEAMRYLVDEQGVDVNTANEIATKTSIAYGFASGIVEFSQADILMKLAGSRITGSQLLVRGIAGKFLKNHLVRGAATMSVVNIMEAGEEAIQNMEQEIIQSSYREYGGNMSVMMQNIGSQIMRALKSPQTKEAFLGALYGFAPMGIGATAKYMRSRESMLAQDLQDKYNELQYKQGIGKKTAEQATAEFDKYRTEREEFYTASIDTEKGKSEFKINSVLSAMSGIRFPKMFQRRQKKQQEDLFKKTKREEDAFDETIIPGTKSTAAEYLSSIARPGEYGDQIVAGKEVDYISESINKDSTIQGEGATAAKLLKFIKRGGEEAINDIIDHKDRNIMVPAILSELKKQGVGADIINKAAKDPQVFGELLTLFNKKGDVKVEKVGDFGHAETTNVIFEGLTKKESALLGQKEIEEQEVRKAEQPIEPTIIEPTEKVHTPREPTEKGIIERQVIEAEKRDAEARKKADLKSTIEEKPTLKEKTIVDKAKEKERPESLISTPVEEKPSKPKTTFDIIKEQAKADEIEVGEEIEKTSIKKILTKQLDSSAFEAGNYKSLRPLAEFILKNIDTRKLDTDVFVTEKLLKGGKVASGTAIESQIDGKEYKAILLNAKRRLATPLHEVMHILTAEEYNSGKEFTKETDRLLEIARKNVPVKSHIYNAYLDKGGNEFITGVYTDKHLQVALAGIKDPKKDKNIFNLLLEAIQKALGLQSIDGSVLDSAFDAIFDVLPIEPAREESVLKMREQKVAEKNAEDKETSEINGEDDNDVQGRKIVTQEGKEITLNNQQEDALVMINDWLVEILKNPSDEISNKFFVLAGFAGTGKSTILNEILNMITSNKNIRRKPAIAITAPTHNAVEVAYDMLSEDNRADALTLQSLLGMKRDESMRDFNPLNPKFVIDRDRVKIDNYDLVVIDEASMINKNLYKYLIEQTNIPVLFLGDSGQLNPVGEVISEVFVDDKVENKTELTKVMRIKGGNPILNIVTAIRRDLESFVDRFAHQNQVNDVGGVYFFMQGTFGETIKKIFKSETYKANSDSRILAWGNPTVEKWNKIAREAVFPGVKEQLVVGETLIADQTVQKGTGESMYKLIQNSSVYRIAELKEKTTSDGIEVYEVKLVTAKGGSAERINIVRDNPQNIDKYVDILTKLFRQAVEASGRQQGYNWRVYEEFIADHMSMKTYKARITRPWEEAVINKQISYGYASTVHKAQGKTFRNALVDEANIDALPFVEKKKIESPGKYSNDVPRKMTPKEEQTSYIHRNKMKYTAFSRASKNLIVLENIRRKADKPFKSNSMLELEVDEIQYIDSNMPDSDITFTSNADELSDESGKEISKDSTSHSEHGADVHAVTFFSDLWNIRIAKTEYKSMLKIADNSMSYDIFKEQVTNWVKKTHNWVGEYDKRAEANLKEFYNKNAQNKIALSKKPGDGGRIHRVAEFLSTSSNIGGKWFENVVFKKFAFKKVDTNHLNKGKKNPEFFTKNFYEMDMARGHTKIQLQFLSFKDSVKNILKKDGTDFWMPTDLSHQWFLALDGYFSKLYQRDNGSLMVFVAAKGGDLSKAIFAEVPVTYKNFTDKQLQTYLAEEIADENMTSYHAKAMYTSIADIKEGNPHIYGQVIGKHETLKQLKHNKYLMKNQEGTIAEDFNRLKIDLNDVWTVNDLEDTNFMILPKDTEVRFNGKVQSTMGQYDGHLISGTRLLNSIGDKVGHPNLRELKTFIRQRSKDGEHYVAFKMMQMAATPGATFYHKGKLIASVKQENGGTYFQTPDGKIFDMLGTDNEAKQRAGVFETDFTIHPLKGNSIGIDHLPRRLDGAAFPVTHGELSLTSNSDSIFAKLVTAYKQHYRQVAKDYLDKFFGFKFDRATLMSEINTSIQDGDVPTELQKLAEIIGPEGKGSEHPNFARQVIDHITNKILSRGLMKVRRKGESTQMTYKPDARMDVKQGDVIIGDNRVLINKIHLAAGFSKEDKVDISYLNDWLEHFDFNILLSRQPVAKVTGVVLRRVSKIRPSEGDVMFLTFKDVKEIFDGDFDGDHGFAEVLPTYLEERFREVMKSDEWKNRDKAVALEFFASGLKQSTIADYFATFRYLGSTLNNSGMIGAITNSKSVLSAINYKGLEVYPSSSNGVSLSPIKNSQIVRMDYINLDITNKDLYDGIKTNGDSIVERVGKEWRVVDRARLEEIKQMPKPTNVFLQTTSENEWANILQMAVDDSKYGLLGKIGIDRTFLLKRMFQISDGRSTKGVIRKDHIELLRKIRAYFNYSEIRQNKYSNGKPGKLNDIVEMSTQLGKRFYDKQGKRFDNIHIAKDLDYWLNNPQRLYLSDGARDVNRKPETLLYVDSIKMNDNITPVE